MKTLVKINQSMASVPLLTKEVLLLLSCQALSPPPFTSVLQCIQLYWSPRRQKAIISSDLQLTGAFDLTCKMLLSSLMNILWFSLKWNNMGRKHLWEEAAFVAPSKGSSLTNWQIIIISVRVDIEMHGAIRKNVAGNYPLLVMGWLCWS